MPKFQLEVIIMEEKTVQVQLLTVSETTYKPYQPKDTYIRSILEKTEDREKVKKQMENIEKYLNDLEDYIFGNKDPFDN